MSKRARVSRLKIRFAIILGIILMASVIFFSVLVSAKEKDPKEAGYKYYTSIQINQGDTLWTIAERYCENPGEIRSYVKELKSINNLERDEIHAGNYLTVVYYSEEYK